MAKKSKNTLPMAEPGNSKKGPAPKTKTTGKPKGTQAGPGTKAPKGN